MYKCKKETSVIVHPPTTRVLNGIRFVSKKFLIVIYSCSRW